ncbi:MAG: RNA-binding S4 domain-containing protein [Candidatus Omnitrophica bacterium]|nr:RNA-binding S4 domain-containing protein [Candidatus Omnitrophota bacterium]
MMDFRLQTEFIELDNLLKATDRVANGAEAKQRIQSGAVKVNGQVELRVRRKLKAGDVVDFNGSRIAVTA